MKRWFLYLACHFCLTLLKGGETPFPVIDPHGTAPLENILQLSPRILSGSEPQNPESFKALKNLGVKTIVSVDGASPNLDAARAEGLRYIHIPIGYDGIPELASLSIIKVLQEDTGRLYFHCHHGRHRGPAAAAIAGLIQGSLNQETAKAFLKQAGTSPDYSGLWSDVLNFTCPSPIPPLPDLHEKAEIGSLAQSMSQADRHWDRVKAFQKNNWKPLPALPEIEPAREALLLAEIFKESTRNLPSLAESSCLKKEMQNIVPTFSQLQKALETGNWIVADKAYLEITHACRSCHRSHRD